jgi:hypothetical protein
MNPNCVNPSCKLLKEMVKLSKCDLHRVLYQNERFIDNIKLLDKKKLKKQRLLSEKLKFN